MSILWSTGLATLLAFPLGISDISCIVGALPNPTSHFIYDVSFGIKASAFIPIVWKASVFHSADPLPVSIRIVFTVRQHSLDHRPEFLCMFFFLSSVCWNRTGILVPTIRTVHS